MKIRWTEESVRLRITPSELETLQRGETIEATLRVGEGTWQVTAQRQETTTALTMQGGHLRIMLAPTDVERLAASDVEGIYFQTAPSEDRTPIRYCIEKDFPCVHPRASAASEPPTETFAASREFLAKKAESADKSGNGGAILLAGGRSRRMGQDKALLTVEGETLLERNLALLRRLTPNVIVVTDRPDRYALPPEIVRVDAFPDTGPLGGLITGLHALGEGAHLVVACDMPFLNENVLRLFLERSTPDEDAVIPVCADQTEPLCGVYRYSAAAKLQRALEAGQYSVLQALNALNLYFVMEEEWLPLDPERACFVNLNTLEDVEKHLSTARQIMNKPALKHKTPGKR